MYFSGQGKLFLAPIVAGIQGAYRWVGNVPDLSPEFSSSTEDHKESYSGGRVMDFRLAQDRTCNLTATIEDWNSKNIAMVTNGTYTEVAGGTVTGEVLPTGLVAGDIVALKGQKVSAVSVKDSTGTPLTLVANTDYTVDALMGTITILDPTGFVQPFKVDYTAGATEVVAFLTTPITEWAVRFEGINTVNNERVIVEFYKVTNDPTDNLPLISEGVAGMTFRGAALLDGSKPANDEEFGQFGRYIRVGAPA